MMQPQRDLASLCYVLLGMGLVMAMHVSHLAPWLVALIALLGLWRYLAAVKQWPLPKLWLLLPLTLLAGLGVMVSYHGLLHRDASVALLALMLALKLMEARIKRDFILLIFGNLFLLICAFLFSQSLLLALYTLLPLLVLLLAWVSLNQMHQATWRFAARLALKILLQALPLAVLLFLLFPRLSSPLWGLPQDANKSMTGLSDSMQPGNISQLIQSSAIAFRVKFKGAIPKPSLLYWRGPVLWHYDGQTWQMRNPRYVASFERLQSKGESIDYTLTLEPHNRNWLLLLDMPTRLPLALRDKLSITPDWQIQANEPVRNRLRIDASASLNYVLGQELDPYSRELATQLNDDSNPRSFALAQSWRAAGLTPSQIIQSALNLYRQQPFVYTLSPPRLGRDAMDDFLFKTRRGFCEHYASSFVFLMRAAGLPARVVTGYQGGEMNPVDHYLIVRQSDAHAWAEVWLQDQGWVRIDPTAAVSPLRIESGIRAAFAGSGQLPLMSRADYPLLRELFLNWDAVNNRWNQYVLGFDQQKQLSLLSQLTGRPVNWQDLVYYLVLLVSIASLLLFLGLLGYFRFKPQTQDPVLRHYQRFLRKLSQAGVSIYAQEGALALAQRASLSLPRHAAKINAICNMYNQLRYAPASAVSLQRFSRSIQEFKIQ